MTYKILSVCGALGYGYDENSLNEAMKHKLDIIGSDAGSMDAGPYYLGTGDTFFERPALKKDFSLMLAAALKQNCPLVLGSCGMAGDTAHLETMLEIAKECFEEQNVKDVKVAVIPGHIDNELLMPVINQLTPLGQMPELTKEIVKNSKIVGQMGIAPFITALEEGAQVIFGGRSCDVAIFAADATRRGIDPGIAFHAGHILECGAVACDPGSASDCLVAEFPDKKSVVFTPPNKNRRATVQSVAAHSLYEESHPSLQFYPEGALTLEHSQYFQVSPQSAGTKDSYFVNNPGLSIKLEGSEYIGKNIISLLFCKAESLKDIPEEYIIYGRNGVQASFLLPNENELGFLIKVTAKNLADAKALSSLVRGYMLHFGYPGRRSTAGNIAFPLSPNEISYESDNEYTSIIVAGTRDPLFIEKYEALIKPSVIELAKKNFPEIYQRCKLEIITLDRNQPLLLLQTVAKDEKKALQMHEEQLNKLHKFIDSSQASVYKLHTDAYEWSIYHLLKDEKLIKDKLFTVKLYQATGGDWKLIKELRPRYESIGLTNYKGSIDIHKVDVIKPVKVKGSPVAHKALTAMATVIRSKDAGVNTITFDIMFDTKEDYELALNSNAFVKEEIAKTLGIPMERIIDSYQVDSCNAIKISAHRALLSGTPGSRDVFGAQQQMKLVLMKVPVYEK